MRCSNCDVELIEGKRFCHACGTPVGASCPHCGAPVNGDFEFCPDCGGRLAEPLAAAAPRPAQQGAMLGAPANGGKPVAIAGERKRVTVLFCDLAGSTAIAERLDPEEYRDLLDSYLELALAEIQRMDGIVNQLAGDGFMALFGAPIALEHASEHAVRAALAIHAALAGLNASRREPGGVELRARIGINTGPVVVGTVGNDLKMDYTAIGDTTNLAARLQAMAKPGSILISEATHRLVTGFFDVASIGPVRAKGKRELLTAYEVTGIRETATPMAIAEARGLTPHVGLDAELDQLQACYARLSSGLPQVVSILGDDGSGKSRLVYEFKRKLAETDAIVIEGRCSSLSQSVPFAPFTGMLKDFFGIVPGEAPKCACEKIEERLREFGSDLEPLYPPLCKLLMVPESDGKGGATEQSRQQIFQAVLELMVGISARAPVVMLIEDLHWIDEASREIVEIATARMGRAPVMLVVSHRIDYQVSWKVNAAHTSLRLRPLSDADSAKIVRSLAGGPLPAELERRIVQRAEGNPFFLEELTRALLEGGQIIRDDEGLRLTRPVDEVRIPDTVEEVIGARLDRLRPTAKRVAQVAAVFGRQFRSDHLESLLESKGIDVPAELSELERRGVIHRNAALSDDEFRFGESFTQAVAYEGLLLKERRQLHEQVAGLLESDPRGATTKRAGLIAHHLARSENRSKAVDSLLAAARNAGDLPSYPSALRLYRQAWKLAEAALSEAEQAELDGRGNVQSIETARRGVLDATLGLSKVSVFVGGSERSDEERAAARGRELAELMEDKEALALACSFQGMLIVSGDRQRFEAGVELITRGLEVARSAGLALTALSIERALAWRYVQDGRFPEAIASFDRVLEELEALGQAKSLTDLYLSVRSARFSLMYYNDELVEAQRNGIEVHELAHAKSNRTIESWSAVNLAHICFALGDYTSAKQWASRGIQIAEAIGNIAGIWTGAILGLASRVELGEPASASRFLQLLDDSASSGGGNVINAHIAVDALLFIGEVERAQRFAEDAARRGGGRLGEAVCDIALGHVNRERGPSHWDEARARYDRAIQLARDMRSRSTLAAALAGFGALCLERGEIPVAVTALREASAVSAEAGLGHWQSRADRLLSGLEALGAAS